MAIVQQNSVFIDPENCGSSVGYRISLSDYEKIKDKITTTVYNLSATVTLADCCHKIDWEFGSSDQVLPKIDAAIDMLKEFRSKYVAMEKMKAKMSKEK